MKILIHRGGEGGGAGIFMIITPILPAKIQISPKSGGGRGPKHSDAMFQMVRSKFAKSEGGD